MAGFYGLLSDFTADSIVAFQEDPQRKIKTLKVIEDSVNLLVGTDRDLINYYNVDNWPLDNALDTLNIG